MHTRIRWAGSGQGHDGGSTARRRLRHAFTLIEIMTVLAVLGILSAIAMPKLRTAQAKAEAVRLVANIGLIERSVLSYAVERDKLTAGTFTAKTMPAALAANISASAFKTPGSIAITVQFVKSVNTIRADGMTANIVLQTVKQDGYGTAVLQSLTPVLDWRWSAAANGLSGTLNVYADPQKYKGP